MTSESPSPQNAAPHRCNYPAFLYGFTLRLLGSPSVAKKNNYVWVTAVGHLEIKTVARGLFLLK